MSQKVPDETLVEHTTDGGGIEDGDNLEHVGQQDLVEEVGLAFLEAVEVDVLFEPGGLAAQLGEDAVPVVSVEEVGGQTGDAGRGSEGHDGQREGQETGVSQGPGGGYIFN
jgi:hypothetical protein